MRYRLVNGTKELKMRLDDIISRLLDLQDQSEKARNKAVEADNINYNVAYDLKQLQVSVGNSEDIV